MSNATPSHKQSKQTKKMTYGKFYALFNRLPYGSKEVKEELVRQHTNGRTASLTEMTPREYSALIKTLIKTVGCADRLRSERSGTLKLLTQLGVDTSDWSIVDRFCSDHRIAGKRFAAISIEGHGILRKKLRAILKKNEDKGATVAQDHQEDKISDKQIAYLMIIAPKNKLSN